MVGFRSVWAGVGRKRAGMAQSWAAGQICLPTSQGPPGGSPAPAALLHIERVPPATRRKPEGCSSQCHPSLAKPEEAKEQKRAVTFYHQRGPIKAFHDEFDGEFHDEHFILMVSTDIWVLLHVSEVQGCRWGRRCFSMVGAHPTWLQRHLLWPCCCTQPLFTTSETQSNIFWLWRWQLWDPKSRRTCCFALSFFFLICESPVTLTVWNSAGNCVFIFRAEENVSRWQPRLAGANHNLLVLNMVSSLAPWPFLERAVLSWYHFLSSHCTTENRGQWQCAYTRISPSHNLIADLFTTPPSSGSFFSLQCCHHLFRLCLKTRCLRASLLNEVKNSSQNSVLLV